MFLRLPAMAAKTGTHTTGKKMCSIFRGFPHEGQKFLPYIGFLPKHVEPFPLKSFLPATKGGGAFVAAPSVGPSLHSWTLSLHGPVFSLHGPGFSSERTLAN